ncbi:sister chromatid cohesion 1 protein 3 isoform X3 [Rhodamnia argentea]|uniref:Sister chromatid cohesion 1 protein 3 isoform X3 n=1 Tax=Rhodamnia argentea TaxID=178133 RepID=A0ABM3HVF0_9MYRT|nr:sister chromatid cohesion 1 protein 3 isoform X3 [Rhodamnia argentea]
MFYSQTFLGRKGPLGTVWCAAHLQHRLKKSHYTSTDIPKTVEYIMFPEVPIALRMSGHLLLGVVRIYSKKVDYLFQECNIILTGLSKVFAPVELNLPEDTRQAPVQSITLPNTFELDAIDLDGTYEEGIQDYHLRSHEEITLIEQIPTGRDPYIVVSFDEDIQQSSQHALVPNSVVSLMEEDTHSEGPTHSHPDVPRESFQDSPPRSRGKIDREVSMPDLPEIEVMRDAVHDVGFENFPPMTDLVHDRNSPTSSEQIMMEKGTVTPLVPDALASGGSPLPYQQPSETAAPADLQNAAVFPDEPVLFEHASPELAIRSSPPVQQPPARKRKRKQLFDECVVLKNSFMKRALDDPSNIQRKRRNTPCSAFGLWKSNKRLRKECSFQEPLFDGMCPDLQNVFKKDYVSINSHLFGQDDVIPEPVDLETPGPTTEVLPGLRISRSPDNATAFDMEIEHLRHDKDQTGLNFLDFVSLPIRGIDSSLGRDTFTPISVSLGSAPELPEGSTVGTGILPTPDAAMSTGPFSSDMETPMTFIEENQVEENTRLSEIPEMTAAEELYFLEAEDTSLAAGSCRSQEIDPLSLRTRAVAQFLQRRSPTAPGQEEESGVSLTNILEGKNRRLCARMFFETLVLKSYGLIDVQQDEAYGDISLKLTPTLSKGPI